MEKEERPNIKITRVTVRGDLGDSITKPKNRVINPCKIEAVRRSYKRDTSDVVRFNYEETDEEETTWN